MFLDFQIIAFELVAVNSPLLTSSPKISDLTKNHFFLLTLAQDNEKYFSVDFSSFWDSLIFYHLNELLFPSSFKNTNLISTMQLL